MESDRFVVLCAHVYRFVGLGVHSLTHCWAGRAESVCEHVPTLVATGSVQRWDTSSNARAVPRCLASAAGDGCHGMFGGFATLSGVLERLQLSACTRHPAVVFTLYTPAPLASLSSCRRGTLCFVVVTLQAPFGRPSAMHSVHPGVSDRHGIASDLRATEQLLAKAACDRERHFAALTETDEDLRVLSRKRWQLQQQLAPLHHIGPSAPWPAALVSSRAVGEQHSVSLPPPELGRPALRHAWPLVVPTAVPTSTQPFMRDPPLPPSFGIDQSAQNHAHAPTHSSASQPQRCPLADLSNVIDNSPDDSLPLLDDEEVVEIHPPPSTQPLDTRTKQQLSDAAQEFWKGVRDVDPAVFKQQWTGSPSPLHGGYGTLLVEGDTFPNILSTYGDNRSSRSQGFAKCLPHLKSGRVCDAVCAMLFWNQNQSHEAMRKLDKSFAERKVQRKESQKVKRKEKHAAKAALENSTVVASAAHIGSSASAAVGDEPPWKRQHHEPRAG